MNEYDLRGRVVAHAFYGELEKIARATPGDIARGLREFSSAATRADPSLRAAKELTGHSLTDSMRNKWALQKARYGARREANKKLKVMSSDARRDLKHGTPEQKRLALQRLEGVEEARGHRSKAKPKPKKQGFLGGGGGQRRGSSGPRWAAAGLGAGAVGTLAAQNQMAGGAAGGGGGEYY